MGSHSVCYLPPDRRDSHTLSNNKSLQRGHTDPANCDRQSSAINQPLPHHRWMRVSKWNFISYFIIKWLIKFHFETHIHRRWGRGWPTEFIALCSWSTAIVDHKKSEFWGHILWIRGAFDCFLSGQPRAFVRFTRCCVIQRPPLLVYISCASPVSVSQCRLIMRPSVEGHVKRCTRPSVRPSVPYLRFSRNKKVVETSNLVETLRRTRVTREANLKPNSRNSKIKIHVFSVLTAWLLVTCGPLRSFRQLKPIFVYSRLTASVLHVQKSVLNGD